MNINKLIKEAHDNAVEKGFYDCGECGGLGSIIEEGYAIEADVNEITCEHCNGTGIDQNKNIPELLMLVITEISEAVEALREKRFAVWKTYDNHNKIFNSDCGIERNRSKQVIFEKYIKDTFEDEIADVFIRLFDLCGYLGIDIEKEIPDAIIKVETDNMMYCLLDITERIINIYPEDGRESVIGYTIAALLAFCNHNNIDIEKHITAKMQYNKTRPKKHGKEF